MTTPKHTAEHSALFPYTRQLLVLLQKKLNYLWMNVGMCVQYTGAVVQFIAQGKLKPSHVFQQASFVGIDTMGICLTMTTFSGMVIALQVATEMVKQGAGNYVGALVAMAMLRELSPVMTGFAIIAMVGSAFAAELASMQINSQVDALRVLHIHPIRYLVVPRVVATVLMLPMITIITSYAGILGGLFISTTLTELSALTYLDSVWQQTEPKDVFTALIKATVFGYLIAIISTVVGINTTGGAKEVGTATTRAVVWAFVAMAIFDYILTYLIYGSK